VIRKDDKGVAFEHISEVRDGLICIKEQAIAGTVILLGGDELMG
jgi:hypothetical protein